jgi:hypothetical protein
MALPGETLLTGAPMTCPDCGQDVTVLRVLQSAAGYYIGTRCDCGPYSRESGYYKTRELAAKALPQFVALHRQLNN